VCGGIRSAARTARAGRGAPRACAEERAGARDQLGLGAIIVGRGAGGGEGRNDGALGSERKLTPHFHTLLPDGVFVHDPMDPDAPPRFRPLDPPSDDEVTDLLMTVEARVLALLRRKGQLPETDADPAADAPTDPLAALSAEAVSAPTRLGRPHPAPIDLPPGPRTARRDGFSLDADLFIHANDRLGLERICRYGLRPAVAVERLSFTDDGRVR
jgi:putative transposase